MYRRLNRRQFYEMFAVGGDSMPASSRGMPIASARGPIRLPLSVFPVLDMQRDGSIFLIHLLLALGLQAEGPLRLKLQFCFQLFDLDRSGELDFDEMTDFLRVAVFVLFALGSLE